MQQIVYTIRQGKLVKVKRQQLRTIETIFDSRAEGERYMHAIGASHNITKESTC